MEHRTIPHRANQHEAGADKKTPGIVKVAIGLLAAGATVAGYNVLSSEKDYSNETNNPEITHVDISFNGTNLRSSPNVGGQYDPIDNTLVELQVDKQFVNSPDTLPVETTEGVYVHHDNNGEWYGIRLKDLEDSIFDEEMRSKLNEDNDGIIWVNDDRATPGYSTPWQR